MSVNMSHPIPIKVSYGTKRLAKIACLTCDSHLVAHCIVKTDAQGDFGCTEHIKCCFCGSIGCSVWHDWVSNLQANTTYHNAYLYPLSVLDGDFYDKDDTDSEENIASSDEDESEDWQPDPDVEESKIGNILKDGES